MRKTALICSALALAAPMPATAQDGAALHSVAPGTTRLDLSVTGKVTRVPDMAIINAGVQTRAATASEAIIQNRQQMRRVLAALDKAGVDERDIQTSNLNLNADYDYRNGQQPRLTGYQATNMVSVKFRELEATGAILDALVAQGANQIHGPNLTIDDPAQALDEARMSALAEGRKRAELYAAALGKQVVGLVLVSETGRNYGGPIVVTASRAMDAAEEASNIVPGEQDVSITLNMSFDLR